MENIFAALPRIANAVFCQPWMIRPSFHSDVLVPRLLAAVNDPGRHEPRAWSDDGESEEERRARREREANAKLAAKTGDWLVNRDNRQADIPYNIDSVSRIGQIVVSGVIGKGLSSFDMSCGGVCVDHIQRAMDHLATFKPKAVKMDFNTPGGTVTGVPECAGYLAAYAENVAPVHGYTDTMCCSAGYYLAASCSTFTVAPSADIGSIGVYCALVDSTEYFDKAGIKVHRLATGWAKGQGMRGAPISEEFIQFTKDAVMEHGKAFFSHVIHSRGDQIAAEAASRDMDPADFAAAIMQGQDWAASSAPKSLYDALIPNRAAHLQALAAAA